MSKALPGENYCKDHQGNYSHYAPHNCTVCKQQAEIKRLKAEVERGEGRVMTRDEFREALFALIKTAIENLPIQDVRAELFLGAEHCRCTYEVAFMDAVRASREAALRGEGEKR